MGDLVSVAFESAGAELGLPAADFATPSDGLSYQSTVPRKYVHRAAISEVFLTDSRQLGSNLFVCAVQWPQKHDFYSIADLMVDPLLAVETLRQAGIFVAHQAYEVPLGHMFLMRRMTWRCHSDRMLLSDRPVELTLRIAVSEIKRRARGLEAMRVQVEFVRDGAVCAEGVGWLRCVSPVVYERMRRAVRDRCMGQPPLTAPVEPCTVGRESVRDVVVGELDESGTRQLRIPLDHPVLFDHPLDHVPGMLAFEAMRQSAVALLGGGSRLPLAGRAEFDSVLELDEECRIEAVLVPPLRGCDRAGGAEVSVTLTQGGVAAVRGVLEMGPRIV